MFSTEINFQVGDGHRIYDNAGVRTNETRDIIVGRHVWIGKRATLIKGAEVADGSVIAAGAYVTKAFQEPNVIIAGLPAKIIRRSIQWEK